MNRRSPARVLTALVLAAGIALGTAGTAGALSPDADPPSGGTPGGPPADAGSAVPPATSGAEAAGAIPCPVGDPKVTNPGPAGPSPTPPPVPGAPDPCAPAADPAPDADGAPPVEPPAEEPAEEPAAEQAGPHAAAPTPALRTVATSLKTMISGVSALVHVPANLDVGPVEISVLFGAERRTQTYNRVAGTYIPYDFPHLDGLIRTANLSIELREPTSAGPRFYEISSTVTVEPMFDITVSPLRGNINGGCDFIGFTDPTTDWVDPEGVQRTHEEYNDPIFVERFAGTWKRVSMNRGLTLPTIEWHDRDPGGPIGQPALPRGGQILPRRDSPPGLTPTSLEIRQRLKDAGGDDCEANLRYLVTIQPVF